MTRTDHASSMSKKAAGQARKAAAAEAKHAATAAEAAHKQAVAEGWYSGEKKASKKQQAEAEKRARNAEKNVEKKRLIEEEESTLPKSKAKNNNKAAPKKTPGLDLSATNSFDGNKKLSTLEASGIDSALDALTIANSTDKDIKVDLHPERRRKAAWLAYLERRKVQMIASGEAQGLRKTQIEERIRKEFEKSPENPMNQLSIKYNATAEEIDALRNSKKEEMERVLASSR